MRFLPISSFEPLRAVRQAAATASQRGGKLFELCLDRGVDLLFPPACALCARELAELPDRVLLCEECREGLVDQTAACRRCGATVDQGVESLDNCEECKRRRQSFAEVVRLGRYQGPLRTAVLWMKRPKDQPLATAMARWLARERAAELAALRADVVVPIPMHWRHRIWRGTNSPEILARWIGKTLRLPVAAHLLSRRRATQPQMTLLPDERRANVRGAFRAARHRGLIDARVLLVDDIMTTGATAGEAARMLIEAGASFVAVAILARAEGEL